LSEGAGGRKRQGAQPVNSARGGEVCEKFKLLHVARKEPAGKKSLLGLRREERKNAGFPGPGLDQIRETSLVEKNEGPQARFHGRNTWLSETCTE